MIQGKQSFLTACESHTLSAFTINRTLAQNPEISSQEFESVKTIGHVLEQAGIPVEYEFCNLPTAFIGRAVQVENSTARLAILCEYDALPGVGHACGHCASGAISTLAALALHQMQVEGYEFNVNIDIIGTPDEEATGCKVDMVDAGVFKEYDFAIMVHLDGEHTHPNSTFMALDNFRVRYYGKPAHAAGEPWNGVNAANGMQLAIHALDMMRQQVRPDTRIGNWIITAGTASNIIPDFAEFESCIRHTERAYLNTLTEQVKRIFEGAAMATGTRVEYDFHGNCYDSMNVIEAGNHLIEDVMTDLHIPFNSGAAPVSGSSDIGNVSFQCPAFHPTLRLAGDNKVCHSAEFAAAMQDPTIEPTIVDGAHIIGLTLLSLMEQPETLARIKAEFDASIQSINPTMTHNMD